MMIAASKPLAALSSALLARKGQARPAMRRQATLAEAGDALGWNDMGDPAPLPEASTELAAQDADVQPETAPVMPVREAASAKPKFSPPVLTTAKGRKAFTLRLDTERHARLRLAVATQGRSAQQLVTEALDAFLTASPKDRPGN